MKTKKNQSKLAYKVLVFKDGLQYGAMGPYVGPNAGKDARADAKSILADKPPGITAQVVKTRWNGSQQLGLLGAKYSDTDIPFPYYTVSLYDGQIGVEKPYLSANSVYSASGERLRKDHIRFADYMDAVHFLESKGAGSHMEASGDAFLVTLVTRGSPHLVAWSSDKTVHPEASEDALSNALAYEKVQQAIRSRSTAKKKGTWSQKYNPSSQTFAELSPGDKSFMNRYADAMGRTTENLMERGIAPTILATRDTWLAVKSDRPPDHRSFWLYWDSLYGDSDVDDPRGGIPSAVAKVLGLGHLRNPRYPDVGKPLIPTGPDLELPFFKVKVKHGDWEKSKSKFLPGVNNRTQYPTQESAIEALHEWVDSQAPYAGTGKVLVFQANEYGVYVPFSEQTIYYLGNPSDIERGQKSLFEKNPGELGGPRRFQGHKYDYDDFFMDKMDAIANANHIKDLEKHASRVVKVKGGYAVYKGPKFTGTHRGLLPKRAGGQGQRRRRNPHLVPGELAKVSHQYMEWLERFGHNHYTPAEVDALRASAPHTTLEVLEQIPGGYLVYDENPLKGHPVHQKYSDESLVSAESATDAWPGTNYEGIEPPEADMRAAGWQISNPSYPEYGFYVVHKPSRKVLSGWEYREDADDSRDEYLDAGVPSSHVSVMTARGVKGRFGGVEWAEGLLRNPDWKALKAKAMQLAESASSAGKAGAARIKEEAQLVGAKARIAKVQSEISKLEQCAKALGNIHRPKLPDKYDIEDGRLIPGMTEFNAMGGLNPGPKEGYEGLFEKREQMVDAKESLRQIEAEVSTARKARG